MKSLLTILLAVAFGAVAYADIQAPPMSDQGPTRKLGRGFSNVVYGWTEIPATMMQVNEKEGNNAAWGYGLVKGVGRSLFRFGTGWYEMLTFPVPAYKSSFRAPYEANTPWTLNRYSEFPPEIGCETRYQYFGGLSN
ncbi:MAG: exosortase system-associated protein, TIGR04073 family [Chthoniobacteraceae bacterium]